MKDLIVFFCLSFMFAFGAFAQQVRSFDSTWLYNWMLIESVQYNEGWHQGNIYQKNHLGIWTVGKYIQDSVEYSKGQRIYLANGTILEITFWEHSSKIFYSREGYVNDFKKFISHGQELFYNYSGKIVHISNYKDGKLEGVEHFFYDSGRLKTINTYQNDLLHGKSSTYYQNGAIKAEGSFKKNIKKGNWKYYHPNGKLESTGSYSGYTSDTTTDEDVNRIFKEKRDTVVLTGVFLIANKHGTWKYFNTEGSLIRTELYQKGKLIRKEEY